MTTRTDRRRILLLVHPRRDEAAVLGVRLVDHLEAAGIEVVRSRDDAVLAARLPDARVAPVDDASGCELIVVLGGDGTILHGAELARGTGAPVLGVNLGHVGFLAEVERDDFEETAERIARRDYVVEDRMALDVVVHVDGHVIDRTWALNEATVEKASRERMIELTLDIDGRPVSTWGCDGLVVATPTGSTAYAFSGGGPVVWPDVKALVVVPLSAHALFARPLVVGPDAALGVDLLPEGEGTGVLWCDGRRTVDLPLGARVDVVRSGEPVRLARFTRPPFADRLVRKFDLSVAGWRGLRQHAGEYHSPAALDEPLTDPAAVHPEPGSEQGGGAAGEAGV